jgi:DNA replication protein DnaC
MGSLHFYEELKNKDVDADKLLAQLLKAELEWRSQKRLARRLKTADFPFEREWGQINPAKNPKINFNKLKQYSDGNFLESKKNLCLIGAPGLGKTHSLVSIGRELCRIGYKVLFYTAIELVTELEEAKKENRLSKLMDKIKKIDLLIIDELGFVPLSDNGARLLFDVFSKRYENGSIAVSTNLSLPKWVQTFGSIELTNALIDRFTHRCDIYVFEGESYRFQESKSKK